MLKQRVLPSTTVADSFFDQQVFLMVNNLLGVEVGIRLGLALPGASGEVQRELLEELCFYLYRTLTIDPEWVVHVEIEGSEIVVGINDAQMMKDQSEDLILDSARTLLALRARAMHRQLSVLSSRELLVPLNFDYGDTIRRDFVTLQLPKLSLAGDFGRIVAPDQIESYDRACKLVGEALMGKLQAKGLDWRFFKLQSTRDGLRLEVGFDPTNPPRAHQLNQFESIVAQELGDFARYSSVYDQLLLQPTSRHSYESDTGFEEPLY